MIQNITSVDDPLTDFVRRGQYESARTHPLLDIEYYYSVRPDVAAAKVHPFVHFCQNGTERPLTSLIFDDKFYNTQFAGDPDIGMSHIYHYLTFGWKEGRRPHKDFNPAFFAELANLSPSVEPYTQFIIQMESIRKSFVPASKIDISLIILNLNKTIITLQCIYFILKYTDLSNVEVIVVDNGSHPVEFGQLVRLAPRVKIVRLDSNRGFGEGNNLGVERAAGDVVVFLNNDVFVTENWLPPLLSALQADKSVGAVGPMFIYPDGRLQEAGGDVFADGSTVQFGKGMSVSEPNFHQIREVGYSSAATLLMRRSDFFNISGFDLCWDPAYYEDTDLCLKLRAGGKKILYMPLSRVYHIENATSSDSALNLGLNNIVQLNREKFVRRWGNWLGKPSLDALTFTITQTDQTSFLTCNAKAVLYTPYNLSPGGGERYILTMAQEISTSLPTALCTPFEVSRVRLSNLSRELNLELKELGLSSSRNVHAASPIDIFVSMGNEVLPNIAALGKFSIFHCQFPFDVDEGFFARNWGFLDKYNLVIVNSEFTKRHYLAKCSELGLSCPPVEVIYPPVQVAQREINISRREPKILCVGRFFAGGHSKKQDLAIKFFIDFLKSVPDRKDIELHLVGAVGSASVDRAYVDQLRSLARGFNINFHFNVSQNQLSELYNSASVLWHLTGWGEDRFARPEKFEHFGISIVEAMSFGVIPVAINFGGPTEIIQHEQNGFLVEHTNELLDVTRALFKMELAKQNEIRKLARKRSEIFAERYFRERIRNLLSRPER